MQKDASLMRDLRIMAYFRQCFSRDCNITTIKELANALASHPPYQVPISSIKIRHLHCQVGAKIKTHHFSLFPPSIFLPLSFHTSAIFITNLVIAPLLLNHCPCNVPVLIMSSLIYLGTKQSDLL